MNLHKAKGLQAPVVFLANPYKKVNLENFVTKHIERRTGEIPTGYFTFSKARNFWKEEAWCSL